MYEYKLTYDLHQSIKSLIADPTKFISIDSDTNSENYGNVSLQTNDLLQNIKIKSTNIDNVKFNDLSYKYVRLPPFESHIVELNQQCLEIKLKELDALILKLIIEVDSKISSANIFYKNKHVLNITEQTYRTNEKLFDALLQDQLEHIEYQLEKDNIL